MTIGVANRRRWVFACALLALPLAWNVTAQAAPRAAELGPQATLAEPAGGYVGRLAVAPEHGPAGTPLRVTGEGFAPEQQFDLVWRTVQGRWKVTAAEYYGREYTPIAYRIATVSSDRDGRIAASFTAPEDFGFLHDIVVQQGNRLLTQTAFKLDMTVKLAAERGPIGTRSRSRCKASAGVSSKAAGCSSTTTSSPASCRR
jgi:hypothetical protein